MKCKAVLVLVSWLLCVCALAGPYGDLSKRLQTLPPNKVKDAADASGLIDDDEMQQLLLKGSTPDSRAAALRDYVSIRAKLEAAGPAGGATPIKDIKKSVLYKKADTSTGENWLSRAINKLRFDIQLPKSNIRPMSTPSFGVGQFLIIFMWTILGLAVAAFLFFAARYFTIQRRNAANRQSKAMLEDDEPERSLDEWLEMAAKLEAEGRFREAVRCLYVACLLKMDEHRVARFDRTQTNWEHYRRIMASPKYPQAFDLLGPTNEFDRIWYGNHSTSAADVKRFRDSYTELTHLLTSPAVSAR